MTSAPIDERVRRRRNFSGLFWLAAIGLFAALQLLTLRPSPRTVAYSELLTRLRQGELADVELRSAEIVATTRGDKPEQLRASRLPGIDESRLLAELDAQHVKFAGRVEQTSWWQSLLVGWVIPIAVLGGLYLMMMRIVGRRVGPLTIGKSRAKIYDAANAPPVTFEDVAGVDEAKDDLVEVVAFLRKPDRYLALGAHVPKGVLLIGPPGTGKTLLARAVAGESRVPFFAITGSDFVEMFVGVGAARVRDLFEQAKERAPCIVFIDEIDAIGRSRGGLGALATHDEREQTLNQLLAEMDGFGAQSGVIIMAATNRPEILDPALVRAGRFDRQVLVDRPDVRGREAILRVHARKTKLDARADLRIIAQRTPGMVGADLANVVNEAALAATRRRGDVVEQRDLEEAVDRMQLGLRKRGRVMTELEKRRVALHESGHTLVALSVEHADPVHRVTIIPRSIGALGATLQLPTSDRYFLTGEELRDQLCVMMGGRAAEELLLGDASTGAENDLERATETARQMVCRFGMSALGAQTFGRPVGARFLDAPVALGEERNFSEETARAIDAEVRALLDTERERARGILSRRRDVLERLVARLLEAETVERAELEGLIQLPAVQAVP
jgi:cell division protease FtsH